MANEVEPAWKPERPLLLTQQQAADLLNISPRMIRYLVRQRKLPVKFIGKDKSKRPKCLIPRSAVEKFAQKLAGQ
jgi:excisionase family DNA binding protein